MTTMSPERAPMLPADAVNPETLRHVRAAVQDVLTKAPSWQALPADIRRDVARDMVTIGAYLVDGEEESGAGPEARALADPPPPDTAGAGFARQGGAVASQAGVAAYTEQIRAVNFPQFVADLIHGTFDAIVTSSIRQMEAYGDLLKNVTKSVGEYMRDNVTTNNARDYLAQQYPDFVEVDAAGGSPVLKPKDGAGDLELPDFAKELGLPAPVDSLDEDTIEQTLVPAARQRMALDRQHLLATMVLMGINRLVVTDGNLEAKVLFQLDTRDRITKEKSRTASFNDEYKYKKESSGWFSPTVTREYTSNFSVATTSAESSTADVDLHTKLSGAVNVRFKTESFPLERMADIIGVDNVGGQAVGSGRRVAAQPPATGGGPPPLPPPLQPPAISATQR